MSFDFRKAWEESKGILKSTVERTQAALSEVDFKKTMEDVGHVGKETSDFIINKTGEVIKVFTDNKTKSEEDYVVNGISIVGAMKLLYLLMSVDGYVSADESKRLLEIGLEFDPEFGNTVTDFMTAGEALVATIDEEDYIFTLHDFARDLIAERVSKKEESISYPLLLWYLLVMAWSDGDYEQSEQDFIRYFVRHAHIEKRVLSEMEEAVTSLSELETNKSWFNIMNRPFSEIEADLNEMTRVKLEQIEKIQKLIAED